MNISDYELSDSPKILTFKIFKDARGQLNSLEIRKMGVQVSRVFTISFSDLNQIRGEHAHKKCSQLLFSTQEFGVRCLSLSGEKFYQVKPGSGLLVPPYNWIQISSNFADCTVVVLASESYDQSDYIKNPPL